MTENELSYVIRGCIYTVYNALGPGLLESCYEAALGHELTKAGLRVKKQVGLPMIYDGVEVDIGYRIDLLVEEKVVVEIKSVEHVLDIHHKQVLTYLRLSSRKLGLLVNFCTTDISGNIFRKVNNL